MHFSTIFRQNVHKGPKRAFLTQQFFTVFLSSIQCNPVGSALSCQIEKCCLDTVDFVFKAIANKDVMSFEWSTRMDPGLFHRKIYKIISKFQSSLFNNNIV